MERRKQKRESQPELDQGPPSKQHRIDLDFCWFQEIPVEIASLILDFACQANLSGFDIAKSSDPTKDKIISHIVCRFVCNQWRDLLHPPEKVERHSCFGHLAASRGWLNLVKWARENGSPWDHLTCAHAAHGGHLEVLKWLRESGCEWDQLTCDRAAENGHFEVLKWARENGCDWGVSTSVNAAWSDHLETLKWLRENGCPVHSNAFAMAANRGQMEVLKWMKDNGCPWDEFCCAQAALAGRLDALKWLRENGCPWDGPS